MPVPARAADHPASRPPVYIGTAGWSLPRDAQSEFPAEGTHLVRYAARLPAAEINTSFYRPHRPATYARWAASVPPGFRFSVKVPRTITHELRLIDAEPLLTAFLGEVAALGPALGCLLVQLPPSLAFAPAAADAFFAALRTRHAGPAVVEPRHASWFEPEADALLAAYRVGQVAADPARVPAAAAPGGWPGTVYYRLHGSPRVYYSPYAAADLNALAARLRTGAPAPIGRTAGDPVPDATPLWCVFDNTASGAATANALDLLTRMASPSLRRT